MVRDGAYLETHDYHAKNTRMLRSHLEQVT